MLIHQQNIFGIAHFYDFNEKKTGGITVAADW